MIGHRRQCDGKKTNKKSVGTLLRRSWRCILNFRPFRASLFLQPSMYQKISRRWPNFMVEFEAEVQEALGVSRNVRGYWGFRRKRTDLHHKTLVSER